MEIFNDLNNWNDTLKMKLKLPLGGSKLLILSMNHSFNWFVRTAVLFKNKASPCVPMGILSTLSALTQAVFMNE